MVHLYNENICDPIPLDNLKNHTALPYITIIQEVIRGMGDRIIITTEGETLEIKIMIEIGAGHTKDRIEIEEMVETLVTVDQGHIQGQLQIEIGLDALNVGNTTIWQGTV